MPRQLVGEGDLFALTAVGESMTGAHITDGDQVVVRSQNEAQNGDVIAAMTAEGETTVKRFKRDGDQAWLLPANPLFTGCCPSSAPRRPR
ncbi:S24 family peptidase [Streptomyces sp. NBC_00237]|uniref:LexA family protein n=1 Tax=Streptomyces sp. NBC_00237 TaxID=2975687 RepID=UPI002B1D9509|nr:S24 family peptidase [Streptomyces sp. NBC_00237]